MWEGNYIVVQAYISGLVQLTIIFKIEKKILDYLRGVMDVAKTKLDLQKKPS